MIPKINDRWLWLGFGVFFFLAAKGIRYAITDIVHLTKLESFEHEPTNGDKTEQPEDSISLENLKILADSPDQNISDSAISLIVSRFQKSPETRMAIIRDLNSKDPEISNRAKTTHKFLLERGDLPDDAGKYRPRPYSSESSTSVTMEEIAERTLDPDGGAEWADGGVVPSPLNPVAGWTAVPRERPLSEDTDEVERRRGRREAMVLNEGPGRVGQANIFRPQY